MKNNLTGYLTLCLLFTSSCVFAWGSGHDEQTRIIFELLPNEISTHFNAEMLKIATRKWSHYPDSFKPFGDEIAPESRQLLKQLAIKNRYHLHTAKGQGTAFMILTDMFRQKKYDQAALWIATIGHALGDAGAPNHHPLIHWYTYMPPFDLKNGKSSKQMPFGSLLACLKTKTGKKVLAEELKDYQPKLLVSPGNDMVKRTLVRLMELELEEGRMMSQTAGKITQAWQQRIDAKTPAKLAEAEQLAARGWVTLMVQPALNSINTIKTAYYFAKNDIPVTEQDIESALKQHKKEFQAKIAQTPISSESIFADLVAGADKSAKIAVILEPSYMMNHGQLGFESKYYAAAVLHTLKANNIPYNIIDVRDLANNSASIPNNLKLVILPSSRRPSSYAGISSSKIVNTLQRYAKAGGKIVQIGQEPIPVITGSFNKVKLRPRLPIPVQELANSTIHYKRFNGRDELQFHFVRNPFTPAGWHKPATRVVFDKADKSSKPCIELVSGKETYIIGIYITSGTNLQHCFLPQLALFPYVAGKQIAEDVSKALFDKKGETIIMSVIKQMLNNRAG